ncbi:MAG TPA: secondary thiamine-phosphate synthase enzyme YjbQ [Anaerolineae bacterium]|jgi:secondary thiamine-phosphate synthase enzyme|nr:secondary thiamine-phosphate synthase enzyme YjbQ [Anaerolineae bacterium]
MVITESIRFTTQGNGQVVDITAQVATKVAGSEVTDGTVTIFSPSATSSLTTIEYESGAVSDLQTLFDRLAPRDLEYLHNQRWGDGNGHSHVRAALLGASLTVPFVGKNLTLGTWQQIVFVDFDVRAHDRKLVLQIMGE